MTGPSAVPMRGTNYVLAIICRHECVPSYFFLTGCKEIQMRVRQNKYNCQPFNIYTNNCTIFVYYIYRHFRLAAGKAQWAGPTILVGHIIIFTDETNSVCAPISPKWMGEERKTIFRRHGSLFLWRASAFSDGSGWYKSLNKQVVKALLLLTWSHAMWLLAHLFGHIHWKKLKGIQAKFTIVCGYGPIWYFE